MVAATVEGVIWGTLAVLVMAVLVLLAGVYGLAELRIWWARQTGRGSCQFCGRPLTIRVVGLLRLPEGSSRCAPGAGVTSRSCPSPTRRSAAPGT
jgi:hypothetical protein